MDFAPALKDQLSANPKAAKRGKRVLAILNERDSAHKRRRLARMERRVRTELGIGEKEAIDWSTIDWPALLNTILSILLKFLPLLI